MYWRHCIARSRSCRHTDSRPSQSEPASRPRPLWATVEDRHAALVAHVYRALARFPLLEGMAWTCCVVPRIALGRSANALSCRSRQRYVVLVKIFFSLLFTGPPGTPRLGPNFSSCSRHEANSPLPAHVSQYLGVGIMSCREYVNAGYLTLSCILPPS